MRRGAALALLLLALGQPLWGCTAERPISLPIPITLAQKDGLVYAWGQVTPARDNDCTESAGPAVSGRLLLDVGTPLSAFRVPASEPTVILPRGEVLLAGDAGGGPGPARLRMCDGPVVQAAATAPDWRLGLDAATLSPDGVLGGNLLSRFSLALSFSKEPDEPLCLAPPCLRIESGDIASNCELADRGEAVLPFRPGGGGLAVSVGDDVVTYPATRITLAACVQPWVDPLSLPQEASCISCAQVQAKVSALGAAVDKLTASDCDDPAQRPGTCSLRSRLQAMERVRDLLCAPGRMCKVATENDLGHQLPATGNGAVRCPARDGSDLCTEGLPPLEDMIDTEELRDPGFQAHGATARLLLSTALPGLLISENLYAAVHAGDGTGTAPTGPLVTLHFPGLPEERAHVTQLGGAGLLALALLSRERFLSPCEELARSRRQRFGLPRATAPGVSCDKDWRACLREGNCAQTCAQAACLSNRLRDGTLGTRRCGYSGPNSELACDDLAAPVASVIELSGPVTDVLVVPDTSPLLQAVNADLRNTMAQVDGIIGISLLRRLHMEIDAPGSRLVARCSCDQTPGASCRAFRRFTVHDADDCSTDERVCLPSGEVAPGLLRAATCR